MNKKGFLLIDAIINVLIVSIICSLCLFVYQAIVAYEDGYSSYAQRTNEDYINLFNSLTYCEGCKIDES